MCSIVAPSAQNAEGRTLPNYVSARPRQMPNSNAPMTAIENGIADLSDPKLKDRVAELKATRDQARLDADRAGDAIDRAGPTITPQTLRTFARTARERMRTENGGYRRDHLRALAQRIEVDKKELRIMGSKSALLRTLVAASSVKTAGF